MTDELLPYYNRELASFRSLAAEFAAAHPTIAGRLKLSGTSGADPHVDRLIEAVALMNARISHRLDDDFPELSDALLNIVYPHYLAPVPSMAIVQFAPPPDLAGPVTVPRGAQLETEEVEGERCRFRTCAPATLWPIEVERVALLGRPARVPDNPRAPDAPAVLRLTLACTGHDTAFDQLAPEALRFFLRGPLSDVHPLYELIHNDTLSVAVTDGSDRGNAVLLDPGCIRTVGFGPDEGMLPYPARSFLGYRLLTEYFVFPEKFLSFDLGDLAQPAMRLGGRRLEVFLYLKRAMPDLARRVSADNFALGCAPVVNLFRQRAEPMALTHTRYEERVVPDKRRQKAMEVHSIESVNATAADGRALHVEPFYAMRHAAGAAFWLANRRPAGGRDPGTEVHLSLVDLDLDPAVPADCTLSVQTLCLNRDLPSRLPSLPKMLPVDQLPVAGIACVTQPTATLRLSGRRGHRWRLISHLALNHLSLADQEVGADALREILKLYDFRDSPETRGVIDGITAVSTARATARAPDPGAGGFLRGVDVGIEFDPARFSGGGMYLLATVLERFLGLYGSINSFTRLTATVKGRPGVLRQWAPRAGDRVLL